jgi:serine protease
MKKIILLISLLLLVIISCQRNELIKPVSTSSAVLKQKKNLVEVPEGDAFSKKEVDNTVIKYLNDKNDFDWSWVDIKTLWSAAQEGDHALAIGYKPFQINTIDDIIHTIDIKSGVWKDVHDAIIELVISELKKNGQMVEAKDIIIEDDKILPIITFNLTDRNVITALSNLENVRYIEPLDYWPNEIERSSSGCSASTETLNPSDYTTTTPSCLVPWNYNNVNIPSAWEISQGNGIIIGVIDAGISNSQTLLGSQFNNGSSNVGRTLTTDYTYGSSAFTSCTHGTSMSGLAVGPRNDMNAVCGVAYQSSLHFIRGCNDVVLDESNEKLGVKNALIKMGDKTNVRIVSMSVGTPFSSGVLSDGVNYAFNKGKMLFAAAGTSFSWTSWWGVIYPAYYSKCNAITGVKENSNTCTVCHDGSQVDFTIPMERNTNSNRNSLSLPFTGNTPTYIGGSSCATATAAGIASLVWSAKPSITRDQVLNCLKTTSQYANAPNGNRGYGNINALAAVQMALTQ